MFTFTPYGKPVKAVNMSVSVSQFELGHHHVFQHRYSSVSCRSNVSEDQIDSVITVTFVIQVKIIVSNSFQY